MTKLPNEQERKSFIPKAKRKNASIVENTTLSQLDFLPGKSFLTY